MKKLFYLSFMLFACTALFTACTDDGKVEDVEPAAAELLTFGFYADDNAALDADYVAELSADMVIRIPGEVDKSALVARFTVGDDDMLLVGSTTQESGVTPNDFNYPIDYTAKDSKSGKSSPYTVRVGNILSKVWSQFTKFNESSDGAILSTANFTMAISPKDNVPYFFISRTRMMDSGEEEDMGVVGQLDAAGKMTVGSEITYATDGTTPVECDEQDIAINADGQVYVMYYYNYKPTDATEYDFGMNVKIGKGSSWTTVGDKFGKTKCGSYYGMEIDPATKRPIVGYMANGAVEGVIAKRDLNMCYFDGAAWSSESLISDLSGRYIYWNNFKVKNNTLYLSGMTTSDPKTYFIYKYDNGNWVKLIDELPAGVSVPASSVGASFDVASDGTLYFCSAGDEDGSWKVTVYECAPGATSWSRLASALPSEATSSVRVSMSLNNDLPVVLYRDAVTSFATIVSLNSETLQWDTPVVLGSVEADKYGGLQLEFDSNGVGYAAFLDNTDGANSPLTVFKYDVQADELPE